MEAKIMKEIQSGSEDQPSENKANAKNPQNEENNVTVPQPLESVQPVVNVAEPKRSTTNSGDDDDKKCCNKSVKLRLSRWCFITILPCIFLVLLTHQRDNDELHLSEVVGAGIICMYCVYFGIISVLFWSGSRLHKDRSLFRIWTKAERVPGWASMEIANHQDLKKFEAIQSISEFSAVDGGIPSFMLSNLGPFTWAIVMMHFASELHCNASVFTWDIADYCEIIGITGLVMIGMFELDPYNKSMRLFHYIGAAAGVGTIIGYVLQANSLRKAHDDASYLAGPIVICVVASVCFVTWQVSNKQTDTEQDKIRDKHGDNYDEPCPNEEELKAIKALLTKLSLRNVISEGIFLFCGALSLAMWLIHYDDNCCLGCAGARDGLVCN